MVDIVAMKVYTSKIMHYQLCMVNKGLGNPTFVWDISSAIGGNLFSQKRLYLMRI